MSEQNPYAAPQSEVVGAIPENILIPGQHNFSNRWLRLLGSIIDGLILLVPFAIFLFLIGFFDVAFNQAPVPEGWIWEVIAEESFIFEVVSTLIVFVSMVVIQGYFWHTRSQSIAKMMLNMRIVTLDGKPASFSNIAFKRTLVVYVLGNLPGVGGIVSLVDALMIFRSEHNCLHDDIAGTRVVVATPENAPQR